MQQPSQPAGRRRCRTCWRSCTPCRSRRPDGRPPRSNERDVVACPGSPSSAGAAGIGPAAVAAVADEHDGPVELLVGQARRCGPGVAVRAGRRSRRGRRRWSIVATTRNGSKSSSAARMNWLSCENSPWWRVALGRESKPGAADPRSSKSVSVDVASGWPGRRRRAGRSRRPSRTTEHRLRAADLLDDHVVAGRRRRRWRCSPSRISGKSSTQVVVADLHRARAGW